MNSISAFEAAARLRSFTKAAGELNLTQGAVSKQIQQLELRLGTILFYRSQKEITLTPSGIILQRAVSEGLRAIRNAVAEIDELHDPCITIAASTGIASYTVLPLVSRFRQSFRDVSIRVIASDENRVTPKQDEDFAILYGNGRWPKVVSHRLADEHIFAVCSQRYATENNISGLQDLGRCDLISLESNDPRTMSIRQWLAEVGCNELPAAGRIIHVSNYDLAIRAAILSQGIALTWAEAPPEALSDGRLVRISDAVVTTGLGEYLAYSESKSLSKEASLFWNWATSTPSV
ncbi:MAG: LysR family transcriptional regulator [Polaromonas sp.]